MFSHQFGGFYIWVGEMFWALVFKKSLWNPLGKLKDVLSLSYKRKLLFFIYEELTFGTICTLTCQQQQYFIRSVWLLCSLNVFTLSPQSIPVVYVTVFVYWQVVLIYKIQIKQLRVCIFVSSHENIVFDQKTLAVFGLDGYILHYILYFTCSESRWVEQVYL